MLRTRLLLLFALAGVASAPVASAKTQQPGFSPAIRAQDLRARLTWLASDARKGRETLSPEAVEASAWIAAQWKAMGLLPKGTDGWFQPFAVPQPVLEPGNALRVTRDGKATSYAVEKDWNPFSLTQAGHVEGGVVFAGYGITTAGPRHRGYDDYRGVDVKGKVVLVLRKDPGWNDVRHASFVAKLRNARQHGAAALLLCNDPATVAKAGGRDVLVPWSMSLGAPVGSGPIPFAFVSQDVARAMLGPGEGASLEALEKALRAQGPQSRVLEGVSVDLSTALSTTQERNARNVIGFLPGRDPDVASQVVVLGAHYDHLGLGLYGSTGGAAAVGKIHNGADDNGSGTVSLLELAEWFAVGTHRPRRSLLFIAFTGEERGLLGSRHYVQHPTVPLADTVAMINMDMVGRLRDNHLQVGGVGTARGLKELVARADATEKLDIQWDPQGTAPTDSTSFYRKKLPVLFLFTGLHADYHKPTDDVERINFPGMVKVCRLCRDVCRAIADRDERLAFTVPPRPPRPPVLGVRPSREPSPHGVVVAAVVPGGPAARAGMRDGDVIVSLAGQVVRDLQALVAALGHVKAGTPVTVVVLRDGEEKTLQVTLDAPGGRRGR
jgi:hypothetical protein